MNDDNESTESESIVTLFDSICFSFGDQDAVIFDDEGVEDPVCYLEIQECSQQLAYQLFYRYRPDYVLVDCLGHVAAEAVALFACMRIQSPFVPVSVSDQHAGQGRLKAVVDALQKEKQPQTAMIVAICCCDNDEDPLLGTFYQAGVHTIIYIDKKGNLREQVRVPERLSDKQTDDDLYVLFTSGTSGASPKAVVGSHKSTFRRLHWFRETFDASPRVGRRTRLTFVDGITELLGTLLHCPSVLLAVEPERLRAEGVLALLGMNPTQITLLPSQLSQLLRLPPDKLMSLERIILSGEPLSETLWNKARTIMPRCEFLNLYGQTESTGDVLYAELASLGKRAVVNGVVAVGRPILEGIRVSADDRQEMIVAGNLANRYLGDSNCLDSFSSGDIGFCRNGIWYVQGRSNEIEKINGVMTSPAEVEAAFSRVYNVAHAIAAVIYNGNVYLFSEKPIVSFSRENMKATRLPWNLIPNRVFIHPIPVSQSVAGKVNRAKLKTLLPSLLNGSETDESGSSDLISLVADVLNLKVACVDGTKSFVELGGDSALAVTLLYQIRSSRVACCASSDITAIDILLSDSITELEEILSGKRKPKRQKLADRLEKQTPLFVPSSRHYSERHIAVEFKACVDASPVLSVDGQWLYIGCQRGLVQKIDAQNGNVVAFRHFIGWMIQVDCVFSSGAVIVCLYKRNTQKSMVISLDMNLKEIFWEHEFNAHLESTPVKMGNQDLCVCLGKTLVLLDLETGAKRCSIDLSDRVQARPAMNTACDVAIYAGSNSLIRVERMSDTSTPLEAVQLTLESTESIGPVFKDLLSMPDSSVFIASSSGAMHSICSDHKTTKGLTTYKVADFPLSPPARYGEASVVVGSYDGVLRCYGAGSNVVWELDVGGCVYAKPLVLPDGSCVVCTTAGDVVHIRDGSIAWRFRIAAEIWSDPVLLLVAGSSRIAFGARDSKLHMVTIL